MQANQNHFFPMLFDLIGLLHNAKPWKHFLIKIKTPQIALIEMYPK